VCMLEVHKLPTADNYSAQYYQIINGARQPADTIEKVVLIEKEGVIEGNMIGIKRYVQISTTYLQIKPKQNELIVIDGTTYRFVNPIKCTNPGFVTFWESEIKTTNT